MNARLSTAISAFCIIYIASIEASLSQSPPTVVPHVLIGPLETLVFCGVLGLVGQGARAAIGLKTMLDYRTPAGTGAVFNLARLLVSLTIGFLAGVVTALVLWGTAKDGNLAAAVPIEDFASAMKFVVAGYIGTDAIEAFTVRYFDRPEGASSAVDTSSSSDEADEAKKAGETVGEHAENFELLRDRICLVDASVRSIPALLAASLPVVTTAPASSFDQDVVDACTSRTISTSSDLHDLFGGSFFAWYNSSFRGDSETKTRFPCADTALKRQHFDVFWDQIPTIFGRPSISAIEFCSLMAINLQESNGSLAGNPEEVNPMHHSHPGLAYPFDAIPGLKQSYNHAPNRTALSLFGDDTYINAHGTRPGIDRVKRGSKIDPRWGGEVWPADVTAEPIESVNGFIMQADFYKFRGRGIIQTTWRSDYKLLIEWLLSDEAATDLKLKSLADRWRAQSSTLEVSKQIDAIATLSSNEDWDLAFDQPLTLAKGVAIDSSSKGNYLQKLGRTASVLAGTRSSVGSLLWFARHINAGDYPERVVPIMKALMRGVAATSPSPRRSRLPDVPVS